MRIVHIDADGTTVAGRRITRVEVGRGGPQGPAGSGGGGGGSGDVVGPSSSVDGRAVLFDGTTGKLIKQAGAAPVLEGDARLTDARTPTAHAASHADGGADELALDASQITSGTVATARLGTGTANSGTFLRGDGSWAAAGGTVDVVSNVNTGRILGRITAGSGDSEELTAVDARTVLGLTNLGGLNVPPCPGGDWVPLHTTTSAAGSTGIGSTALNSVNAGVLWQPVFIGRRIGVNGLGIDVPAGNAGTGAVVRLMLFADNGSGRPGVSVAQVTAGLDTTGVKEIAFTEAFIGPGWFHVGVCVQSLDTSGTNPTFRSSAAMVSYSRSSVPSGNTQHATLTTAGPIVGTVPDNPTTTGGQAGSNTRPNVWMKVSSP